MTERNKKGQFIKDHTFIGGEKGQFKKGHNFIPGGEKNWIKKGQNYRNMKRMLII